MVQVHDSTRLAELVNEGLLNREIGARLGIAEKAVAGRLNKAGITRPPKRLTPSQLKQCQLDPVWEARREDRGTVPADRIVCRVCGLITGDLNYSGGRSHLVRDHDMTPEAYRRKYPGARTTRFDSNFANCAGT